MVYLQSGWTAKFESFVSAVSSFFRLCCDVIKDENVVADFGHVCAEID